MLEYYYSNLTQTQKEELQKDTLLSPTQISDWYHISALCFKLNTGSHERELEGKI